MCGIAGIVSLRDREPIDAAILSRMNDVQYHRGPDQDGVHIEPGVGLAHRRLSIIDLSSGRQPLFNEDGTVVVVFNGEIYNFPELTRKLRKRGHVFRTQSDTEVIVHAWEEWRETCVEYFRGMFAFALWDRNHHTLFLARDRLGIKPLYYAVLPNWQVVFGSELKALLEHPKLPREVDPRGVEDYFSYGYVPEPRTILKGVFKLPPGHLLQVQPGVRVPDPRAYWDIPFETRWELGEADATEELIERFRDAVKVRMIADVPLGAFLSGGVDSSGVVAMMAGLSEAPVKTCSISFGDPKFNEAHFASEVAERYKTEHFVEGVASDEFLLLDKLARIYDEPYADSSAMPTYRVCELARKRVKVALSGDGGDELFAGYRRYRWHVYEDRIRSLVPHGIRKPLFALLGRIYPKADWAPRYLRAKSTLEALARDPVEGYFHSVSLLGDSLRKRLFSQELRRELQGYQAVEVLKAHARQAPEHPLSKVQYLDMKTYLVGDILTKVDRASMANSLEVRVPILDHEFVEWASALPPSLTLRGREGKSIFKKALEPKLPKDILYREKMGFSVPLASWFRGKLKDHVREAVLGTGLAETGYFNGRFLREMVDQHESGRRDHSAPLWSLLMFEAFQRQVLGNDR